jgi:predicted Fe-Mo cluster-binding NifX family protein
MEDGAMKVAAATSDGKTISMHFGQAPQYVVVTVENGQITNREVRTKAFHHHGPAGPGGSDHDHGNGPHAEMAAAISDCQAMLVGGMGRPAYVSLKAKGIEPIITSVRDIDEAVQAYLNGSLDNLTERLH